MIRRMPPAPAIVTSQLSGSPLDWYLSQGREVAAAYGPRDDVWFRHRDMHDLDAWFRLLPALLPMALKELQRWLGE